MGEVRYIRDADRVVPDPLWYLRTDAHGDTYAHRYLAGRMSETRRALLARLASEGMRWSDLRAVDLDVANMLSAYAMLTLTPPTERTANV